MDGVNCVQSCAFAVHATERRCIDECDSWYSRVEDGHCVEQTWRKSTAIAVPIVAVVAIAVVVVVIILLARKRKTTTTPVASDQTEMHDRVERGNVTGPEE